VLAGQEASMIKAGDFTIRGLVAEPAGHGLEVDYHSV
jgi:hypothetical protein